MSRPEVNLTAHEVAEILRTDIWEVARLCRAGKIKASKPQKKWLIAPADLAAYIDAHSNTQDAA